MPKKDPDFAPEISDEDFSDEEESNVDLELKEFKNQVSGKKKKSSYKKKEKDSVSSFSDYEESELSNSESISSGSAFVPDGEEEDAEEESCSLEKESLDKEGKEVKKTVKEKKKKTQKETKTKNKDDKDKTVRVKKQSKKKKEINTTSGETIKKEKEKKIEKKIKKKKELLDSSFDLKRDYFYQNLTINEKTNILELVKKLFEKNIKSKDITIINNDIKEFITELSNNYPNLKKGKNNIEYVTQCIESIAKINFKNYDNESLFAKCNALNKTIVDEYFNYKPTVNECHFFPNVDNEAKVANILRTAKKTLDIAIFALTNDSLGAAIEECFKRGIKIRIIADDECAKFMGGEVFKLAAMGIPTKTDNSVRFHMHHKFAVIDNSVVITGSFNWTSQAVKYNQENILFYECPEIAKQYTAAYNKLWEQFEITITAEEGKKQIAAQGVILQERAKKREETMRLKKIEREKQKLLKGK